ncbi:MAG: hypothetical protein N2749_04240 [Clostridia bacterium]|nr:hypothetical protein [Clostridia bacterium]
MKYDLNISESELKLKVFCTGSSVSDGISNLLNNENDVPKIVLSGINIPDEYVNFDDDQMNVFGNTVVRDIEKFIGMKNDSIAILLNVQHVKADDIRILKGLPILSMFLYNNLPNCHMYKEYWHEGALFEDNFKELLMKLYGKHTRLTSKFHLQGNVFELGVVNSILGLV